MNLGNEKSVFKPVESVTPFTSAPALPATYTGVARVGTTLYVGDGGAAVAIGGSSTTVTLLSSNTASQNTAAIQAALDSNTGKVIVNGSGTLSVRGWLILPSNTYLEINCNLLAENGRASPVIRNRYCGQLSGASNLSRVDNVATVNDVLHTKKAGDTVWVSGGSDASYRGLATVLSTGLTENSWSYASTGTNGTVASGTWYNMIPIRRFLAGSSFSATTGIITVTDPNHDLKPGFNIYTANSAGSTFAPGMITVIKVTKDTWSYKVTGTSGVGTGTTYLSYDYNIIIAGIGQIDGNRLNQGNAGGGNSQQLSTVLVGCVNNLMVKIPLMGSSLRGIQLSNCTSVVLNDRCSFFDVLVGAQFEGGADNVLVDLSYSSSCQFADITQQRADDYIAFTGVVYAAGVAGNYDDMISPYGLTFFRNIDVRKLVATNSLNGVKITASSTCPYLGVFNIGSIKGQLQDNNSLLGAGSAISIIDDGPGLLGTALDTLNIQGPIEWSCLNGVAQQAALMVLNGTGTIKKINANCLLNSYSNNSAVRMSGMTVDTFTITDSKFTEDGNGTSNPFVMNAGLIKHLNFQNCTVEDQNVFYAYGSAVIYHLSLKNIYLNPQSTTLTVLNLSIDLGLKTIDIDGLKTNPASTVYANKIIFFNYAILAAPLSITLKNINLTTGVFMGTDSTSATGTVNVFVDSSVTWAPSATYQFIRAGALTWNVHLQSGASIPAEKLFFFGYGISTLRLNGSSSSAKVNMNDAASYGSAQMSSVSLVGDEVYNSTAGTLPIGRLVNRAAGWSAI